jgi:integration host factor subunit beta
MIEEADPETNPALDKTTQRGSHMLKSNMKQGRIGSAGPRAGFIRGGSSPARWATKLIERIAAENPHLYQRDVETIVNTILDTITAAPARGDRVELRDFGVFAVKRREARSGRNPRNGAEVAVSEKVRPKFKPGRDMHRRLNPSEE